MQCLIRYIMLNNYNIFLIPDTSSEEIIDRLRDADLLIGIV